MGPAGRFTTAGKEQVPGQPTHIGQFHPGKRNPATEREGCVSDRRLDQSKEQSLYSFDREKTAASLFF